jgi:hypothetical protein
VNWELETVNWTYCYVFSDHVSGVVVVRFLWDVTEFSVLRIVVLPPSSASSSFTKYILQILLCQVI